MDLSDRQINYFERAKREGYLILHDYDPETHPDLELEWRAWCEKNSAPVVKVEVDKRGATVSYSLLRFPMFVTDLTEAEIDELLLFSLSARGSERPECFPDHGHIGLIKVADAQRIATRMVEFCKAGIRHWMSGAVEGRYEPARREETA